MTHRRLIYGVTLSLLAGCGTRTSSLLLERQTRGPMVEAPSVATGDHRRLEPTTQTLTQGQVEVTVTHATPQYLKDLFGRREIFGQFAGHNPFFPEQLVFYVKIINHSTSKIRINPAEFVLIDDRGNQYASLSIDYANALAEFHQPVGTVTRGVLEEARPGYFGFSLPVGKLVAQKPQGRFALITRASLQSGYLYPDVVHDGLVAFWTPNKQAGSLRLMVANIKTSFDANDFAKTSEDFPFTFNIVTPQ